MTRWRLVTESLRHYWRGHVGLLLGSALAAAVLSGSLLVGDSVRASLRRVAAERLGAVRTGVLGGERWFTQRLAEQVEAHRAHLLTTGQWLARERARSEREVERLLQDRLLARLQTAVLPTEREVLLTAVAQRQIDPYTAADQLMALVLKR